MIRLVLLIRRDCSILIGAGVFLPVLFFLLVAVLFPFAVGSDAIILSRTGSGILWVAALLASLLPIDRLIIPDVENGFFDHYAVRGISEEWIAVARIIAHWVSFAVPLMVALLPASALLSLKWSVFWKLEAGFLLATPGLASLGVMIAALTARIKSGSGLAALLLLPLAVPLLIFGAGAVDGHQPGAFLLLAACSLFLLAVAPFVIGAALRIGQDG
ncbi:heme exporter protein CcmB [Zymomonas mobilis]|uniref:heme exporter protein CcmB n=1 Tax=Zymomonas mobilis TaxID=542 RepID=UPI0039ECF661